MFCCGDLEDGVCVDFSLCLGCFGSVADHVNVVEDGCEVGGRGENVLHLHADVIDLGTDELLLVGGVGGFG